MKESLTSSTLFNTIAMARHESVFLILVTEGPDDSVAIREHVGAEVQLISGVGGRLGVLEAAERAEKARLRSIFFVIDADYDRFMDEHVSYPQGVIATKFHDLFMDIVLESQPLLERILEVHLRSATRSPKSRVVPPRELIEAAMRLATTLGTLRVVNEKEGFGLRLRNFPLGELSLRDELRSQMAELAIRRTPESVVQVDQLVGLMGAHQLPRSLDSNHLVGDHDFFGALAVAANKLVKIAVSGDTLFNGLLLSLRCDAFVSLAQSGTAVEELMTRNILACPCAA